MKKTVMIVKGIKADASFNKKCNDFLDGSNKSCMIVNLHSFGDKTPEIEIKQFHVSRPITRRVKEYLIG